MTNEVPKLGEIWEDAEGTLYTIVTEDGVGAAAFLCADVINLYTNPLVALPMRRIFLNDGTLDEDFAQVVNYDYIEARLRYPSGSNIVK